MTMVSQPCIMLQGWDIEAIELLVEHGVDKDAVAGELNQTPMMYALHRSEGFDSVEKLIRLGAKFDIPDVQGNSVEAILRQYANRNSRFLKLVALIDQIKERSLKCVESLVQKNI